MKQNRREFITTLAAAGMTVTFATSFKQDNPLQPEEKFPIRLFSKPLDSYDFDFMCECAVKSGIGGFDLTVRNGGKAEPAYVESVLPRLAEEARKYNLAFDMMVTGIVSATDPLAERVLKTASELGIKYYRLGWLEYDDKLGIRESLKKYRATLREVVELNRKYKIHGSYQNHSGAMIGGPVWDLDDLLRDLPPESLGIQYDVRHATVEGANSWILGLHLIADHIQTIAIKDFTWKSVNGKPEAVTVPLGEGIVNWELYFKTLKELKVTCPVTLHIEYPLLDKGEEKVPLIQQQNIIVSKLRKDMDFLNVNLKKYELT